ncbi:hypothetical protein ACFPN0_13560 [Kitasatospora cinereorecta]
MMARTPEHTGRFLDREAEDRPHALFHLVDFRGLRRGEACGQRWTDAHLDAGLLTLAKQLVNGWEVYEDDPNRRRSAHHRPRRAQQNKDRETRGRAWVETGRAVTRGNGKLLHPANVTRRFIELHEEIAGAGRKGIQEMLGHSSITITSDTYRGLLPEAIWRSRRLQPGGCREHASSPRTAGLGRVVSLARPTIPCRMMLICGDGSGRALPRPLTQTAPDEKSEAE